MDPSASRGIGSAVQLAVASMQPGAGTANVLGRGRGPR